MVGVSTHSVKQSRPTPYPDPRWVPVVGRVGESGHVVITTGDFNGWTRDADRKVLNPFGTHNTVLQVT